MQSRKLILNISGIIIFLAAGAAAMFFMPSDKTAPKQTEQPAKTVTQSQPEPAPAPTPEPTPQTPAEWYVYITGAVKTPGVYTVPENARIFQAVDAAGGFTPRADRTAINLAEPLTDGAHIHIAEQETFTPTPAPAPQPQTPPRQTAQRQSSFYIEGRTTGKSTTTKGTKGGIMVDVNHATAKELEQLNGIGPAISKRIVEYRQTHGRFNTPEDLINVRGIGPAKLEKMRSQILIR